MKKNVLKFTSILLLACLLYSCKKKKTEETKCEMNTINSNNTYTEPDNIYGLFQITKQYSYYRDTLKSQFGFTSCIIYDTLISKSVFNYNKGIDVGAISCNGVINKKEKNIIVQPNTFFYYDSLNLVKNKPSNWVISGNSNFAPINFVDNTNYPVYSGYSNLQDTLFINANNTISITNFSGADEIVVSLRNAPQTISKPIYLPNTTVTFNSDEMVHLLGNSGSNIYGGEIFVYFTKRSFISISGKIYQVNSSSYYIKSGVYIKY